LGDSVKKRKENSGTFFKARRGISLEVKAEKAKYDYVSSSEIIQQEYKDT
jgi:hypothetical protein